MKNAFDQINLILANWDPLEIGNINIAKDEYLGYVNVLVRTNGDKFSIKKNLIKILMSMGLTYDPLNPKHQMDVELIANKISLILTKEVLGNKQNIP